MNLIGLLRSRTRGKILRFFFSNPEKKYYLRELEKILHLPVGNIRRELVSLEKAGLFKREKIGNLVFYSLNKKSSFLEIIEYIVSKSQSAKRKDVKQNGNTNLLTIKKDDLELLLLRINELKNILENFQTSGKLPPKKFKLEKFLNLEPFIKNRNNEK